ncbi:alpha/beta fold hydrolase, partial [Streptomyces griseoaurantiacus]|uniref:alpha/beta fold hydrolase n=1 Tax=Streptomyces griseoaurantiacus TaxID=68213 RepID=UPI00296EC9D2
DPTVLRATYGPRMGEVTGTLRGWSVVDRLEGIAAPTLLLSGSYDHVAPAAMLPFHQRVRDVRWAVLPDSGHFPHIDERELCMRFVAEFLASHD